MLTRRLICGRHTLDLLTERSPIIRLQLRVLDALLAPLLVQPGDVILALLEEKELITDAFPDEDAAGVLLDNGFFVLQYRQQ